MLHYIKEQLAKYLIAISEIDEKITKMDKQTSTKSTTHIV